MRNYQNLWSGAGCLSNLYTAIRTKQNFNDGKFYNITINMSYFSAYGVLKFSIVNESITNTYWDGFACGTFHDITRDILFYRTNPTSLNNSVYILNINPNGTFSLYENGVLINQTTTSKSKWYLQWDTYGSCVGCGSNAAYFYVYNYNATTFGKKNTDSFSQLFSQGFSKNNIFEWNCKAEDDQAVSTFAASNRTFSIDSVAPVINITYPYGTITYAYVGQNLSFNWTVYDADGILGSCWYKYNGVNISIPCSQNSSSIILTEKKNLTFYANDTANNIGSFIATWNYSTIEHNFSYQEYAYETENQNFILNVSSDVITSAYLVYNGVQHAATSIVNSIPDNIVSLNMDTPATTGNITFYWILTTNSGQYTTTNHSQNVNPIYFTHCNATVTAPYINFTYRDEISLDYINASVQSASWNYWIGGGDIKKSYIFTDNTEYPSYAFCFYPQNKTLTANYIYKATSAGYATRTFNSIVNLTLTNSSTSKLLYLIKLTDSGPVVIQVTDTTSGNVIENARVTIVREIEGTPIAIFDGYTDAAGTASAYLSSVVTYTITASKDGCGSTTKSITPVGSYNINLNCQGNITKYTSAIDGVTYQRTPAEGIISPGTYIYGYYITSYIFPMVSVMFQLVDDTGTVFATNQTDISSGYPFCNSSACLLTISHTSYSGDQTKGRYYVNLGNQTNNTYVLLEGDAYWRFIVVNPNNSQQAIKKFATHLNDFFNQWGNNNANCIVHLTNATCSADSACKWISQTGFAGFSYDQSACILRDDLNKMEFNRIIIIFFMMVIILFIMGKTIGYEMTNPGSFVAYLTVIIIILSMLGFFTFAGLTPWDWFNQYIYAFICLEFSIGYNLSIVRRYSA
jgi:hypothetical protein